MLLLHGCGFSHVQQFLQGVLAGKQHHALQVACYQDFLVEGPTLWVFWFSEDCQLITCGVGDLDPHAGQVKHLVPASAPGTTQTDSVKDPLRHRNYTLGPNSLLKVRPIQVGLGWAQEADTEEGIVQGGKKDTKAPKVLFLPAQ